jgi:methionyl-tRNA formyltransferase
MTNLAQIKFIFFGSSPFSEIVLKELEKNGFTLLKKITSAKEPLPSPEELKALGADVFIVASFGKILPKAIIEIPKFGSLNVHPSLLPELRGPAPIQNIILGRSVPGVTIMKMDEYMDHGPILAQEEIDISPWPDHYAIVESKLAQAGGSLLSKILLSWILGEREAHVQDEGRATRTKMIIKEDGLIDLSGEAEVNLRKVLAYSRWPGAYFFFKTKTDKNLRVVVKDAKIVEGKFIPTRVIPEGKNEMVWEDFLRGNS